MTSLAAVVIPVLDGARFLPDAVASVAEQALDVEVLVVDDGSTDGSAEVARDLGVACIRQPNAGPAAARNAGIAATRAPLLSFLDVDDLIPPGALARQLDHLATHRDAGGVMGRQSYQVLDGASLPDWALADRVGQSDEVVRHHVFASVIRRSTFDRVGPFDPAFRLSEDVEWLMRASDAGVTIDRQDEVARIRRIHGANLTYDTAGVRRAMFEALAGRARRKRADP